MPSSVPGGTRPAWSAARPVRAGGEGQDVARSARRRSPAVAAVAAAVLLAGGGGAWLAASAGDGSGGGPASAAPAGNGAPPPLALDGYSAGAPHAVAPGEPDPNGVTYTADGPLPDGPRSAAVHWPKGEVGAADVARLARALGLTGTPVAEGKAWRIGDRDGQGPALQVNRQAPGTWTFHRYAPGTDDCRSVTVCAGDPAAGAGDPVGEEAARQAAAPVLKAVGQGSAEVDAGRVVGARRVVNADPVVGGLPTYGRPTGVTVGARDEVVAASGQLTAPVRGAEYPVLGAERTLALMNAAQGPAPRAGAGGCASPVPLGAERPAAPCEEAPGAPARERIAVEDAVFGLASHSVGARPALVPSWLFEVRAPGARDTYTVTYPAIDPAYLSPARQDDRPGPRPSEPGDAPRARDVRVEGYTAEGRELTVRFTGGVCADYTAEAVERSGRVTVTVTEKPWRDKVCILIAKVHHRTVQLDEPLGDRRVVGSDGEGVPLEKPGARLPERPAV
ncbi:membrane protein [Streptomyces cinereospinus]